KSLASLANRLSHYAIQWHHFGDGPQMSLLEREKSEISIKNLTITLHGRVENSKIYDFYRYNPVDLFINLSSSEGIPVSIMEAISCGIPVVATNVGGTK